MKIHEIRTLRGANYWSGYWKKLIIMRLDIENSTALAVEATIIAVADSLADAFAAPPQDQVPIDVVTVSAGQVDANGRVTQSTSEVTGIFLAPAIWPGRAYMDQSPR